MSFFFLKAYLRTCLMGFYSQHHASEKVGFGIWLGHHGQIWVFKFFCGVWKPNSKSHISAAWYLLLTQRHKKLEQVFKILSDFSKFRVSYVWRVKHHDSSKHHDFLVEFGIDSEILRQVIWHFLTLTLKRTPCTTYINIQGISLL